MQKDDASFDALSKFEIHRIWKDRKRYLGLPISFTKYSISKDRIFVEKGLLNTTSEETLLYRVRDISTSISLWQRIFRVGSITLNTSDESTPQIILKNIKRVSQVKELLHQQVEKMKVERRMYVGELLDGGNALDGDESFLDSAMD